MASISICSSLPHRNMQLCGSLLADALITVCNNPFVPPDEQPDFIYNKLLNPNLNSVNKFKRYEYQTIPFPFSHRMKRGIISECCKNYCDYNQLRSYCAWYF